MLKILDTIGDRNCKGVTRRELLQIGTLGIGSLSLPSMFAARAGQYQDAVKNKAVVVLFLGGGPPQHETFDPKMGAPAEYRAMFGEVQTTIPGITFGKHFSKLAKLADQLTVVRSYQTGIASHRPATTHVVTGGGPSGSTLGSIFARVAGATNPQSGMPNNVIVGPAAGGADFVGSPDYTERCAPIGSLGAVFRPFNPSGGGELKQNMELRIPRGRLDDRRTLLSALDRLRERVEARDDLSGVDRFNQQAFDVLVGSVTQAFDFSKEDPKVLQRYDTSHLKMSANLLKKKPRDGFAQQTPEFLGKQMLMARRLVEAGCGFVTVTSTGWDFHGNRFGVDDGMPLLGVAADHVASAFIEDIQQRGLSNDVLLVITGEFGRTPKINNKAGRDHWSSLCPLVLAGGGLKMGHVIGRSDRYGAKPATDPIRTEQLASTILHTLIDPGILRLHPDIPADIKQTFERAAPIPQLI